MSTFLDSPIFRFHSETLPLSPPPLERQDSFKTPPFDDPAWLYTPPLSPLSQAVWHAVQPMESCPNPEPSVKVEDSEDEKKSEPASDETKVKRVPVETTLINGLAVPVSCRCTSCHGMKPVGDFFAGLDIRKNCSRCRSKGMTHYKKKRRRVPDEADLHLFSLPPPAIVPAKVLKSEDASCWEDQAPLRQGSMAGYSRHGKVAIPASVYHSLRRTLFAPVNPEP